jgi:hypothetical protein
MGEIMREIACSLGLALFAPCMQLSHGNQRIATLAAAISGNCGRRCSRFAEGRSATRGVVNTRDETAFFGANCRRANRLIRLTFS